MHRRQFLATGIGGVLGVQARALLGEPPLPPPPAPNQVRAMFPRLARDNFVNAAAGTPLGVFAETGLKRYVDFQRLGPGDGREEYVAEMRSNIRGLLGQLIGARSSEIALVHCTKAGEQIVIDGLDPMRDGRNIVTNDMHFSGSLHNLVGLKKAGADVRIVRARGWDVRLEDMQAAIDDRTALVAVTLVSNINGRIEPVRRLAEIAHAHGAYLYADVIQAAGVLPFDVRELGVDFAAANGYKWLYGVHGAGFLYVREELQGTVLPDRLFPGHVGFNYSPWVTEPEPDREPLVYEPPTDASRYEPGHVSYLSYCALYEGLKFISSIGVEAALEHSIRLNRRLEDQLDSDRYESISPHSDRSPIITFVTRDATGLEKRLRAANVVVSLSGNRIRVSAAVYNEEGDIDRLAEVMNA